MLKIAGIEAHAELAEVLQYAHGRAYLQNDVDFSMPLVTEALEIMADLGHEEITLYITSPGGGVDAGLAIIRTIQAVQARGVRVIGVVRGTAESMGFHILQACDERRMGSGDILMAHGTYGHHSGDLKDLEAQTKLTVFWRDHFVEATAGRVAAANGESEAASLEYWKELLERSTPVYFLPDEALALGLIDVVE